VPETIDRGGRSVTLACKPARRINVIAHGPALRHRPARSEMWDQNIAFGNRAKMFYLAMRPARKSSSQLAARRF
jgi:hypothetical protein